MNWVTQYIELSLRIVIYLTATFFVSRMIVMVMPRRWKRNRSVFRTHRTEKTERNSQSRLNQHLELLLRSTWKRFNEQTVSNFTWLTAVLFISCYCLLQHWNNVQQGTKELLNLDTAVYALLISLLPYAYLRVKLYLLRNENSYSIVEATELLLMKVRLPECHGDIYRALYETSKDLSGNIRKTFGSVVAILQIEGKQGADRAIQLFVFQIHNSWAQQLGILILNALRDNRNIEHALQKITEDMHEIARMLEDEKGEYMESIMMGYFPIFLIPAAIYGLNWAYPGIGLSMIWNSSRSLHAFIVTVLFGVVALVTAQILKKPRNEA